MNTFEIGEFQIWKDDAGFILIASRDRSSRNEEKWIVNFLDSKQAKEFLKKFSELIG